MITEQAEGAPETGEGTHDSIEAAAAHAVAQADTSEPTASQPAEGGETSQPSAQEQFEIVWNGQKKNMTREEVIAHAQKAYNITQREQEVARTRKDLTAKLERLDKLIEEAERRGENPEDAGPEDPVAKLSKEVEEMRSKAQIAEWEKAFSPIQQKFPNISEKNLLNEFTEKVKAGEAEDTSAGLMAVAEEMDKQFAGITDKRIEAVMKNPNDPRMKAYNEKLIADYVAGKVKLAHAGGEPGATSTGTKPDSKASIADIAAKLRAGTI